MTGTSQLTRAVLIAITALCATPFAWGWGCKGHEVVAMVGEAHLTPRARAMAFKILADGPISQTFARYCKEPGLDAFVDSSTWADDERSVRPETGPWHFIDIPRGARESSISQYCQPVTGCLTSALATQLGILRDSRATAQARADALRFLIHFVGDIHQPLHNTTNNDRGGNCVPVTFFDRAPRETNSTQESYNPNLHEIWDTEIINRFLDTETSQQAANELDATFHAEFPAWQSQPPDFMSWAWESHQLAEVTVYGRLPNKIAIETPRPVGSCADDDHISTRMLELHESLGAEYEDAAAPVVRMQLAKAGIRLAALLNSIWP